MPVVPNKDRRNPYDNDGDHCEADLGANHIRHAELTPVAKCLARIETATVRPNELDAEK